MATSWFVQAWVDGVSVAKSAIRNGLRDYVALNFSTAAELQAATTGGILTVVVGGQVYKYDSTDTTTADNGNSVLVSADSQRYKRVGHAENMLINGCMRVFQRVSVAGTDDTYGLDRWVVLTQTGAVAVSQLTNPADGIRAACRLTQSQASAQRFGLVQIVESNNSSALRSEPVTLTARVRCSASTTIRYAILAHTTASSGAADTVTSDVVSNWTSTNYSTGNFFASGSLAGINSGSTALTANTFTDVTLSGTMPSTLLNAIVIFWTDSAQAQNVTLDVTHAQLQRGLTATPFEQRPFTQELALCQRYYAKSFPYATAPTNSYSLPLYAGFIWSTTGIDVQRLFMPVPMRATPTVTMYGVSGVGGGTRWAYHISGTFYESAVNAIADSTESSFSIRLTGSGLTYGDSCIACGSWVAEIEL